MSVQARARTCTDQDKALDQLGIVAHDLLSDHPAHRQAQQVDALVAQASDNVSRLLARLLQGRGNRAAAGAHARQIQEDQVVTLRELIY